MPVAESQRLRSWCSSVQRAGCSHSFGGSSHSVRHRSARRQLPNHQRRDHRVHPHPRGQPGEHAHRQWEPVLPHRQPRLRHRPRRRPRPEGRRLLLRPLRRHPHHHRHRHRRPHQANANPYRYTSGYRDNDNGLYKLGYRYYDTLQGRFTQQDPSGQESNLFAYTGGDPVNFKDLSGKSFLSVVNGFSAGIVGEGVNIGCQVGTLTLVEEGCAGVGIVSGVAVNEGLTAVDSAIGAS